MSPRKMALIGLRLRLASSLSANSLNKRSCALTSGTGGAGGGTSAAAGGTGAGSAAGVVAQAPRASSETDKARWRAATVMKVPRGAECLRCIRPLTQKGRHGNAATPLRPTGLAALPEEVVDHVPDFPGEGVDQDRIVVITDPAIARRRVGQAVIVGIA